MFFPLTDTESATIAADGEDLWTACTNASKLCPDAVTVNIGTGGTNGGVIGRPGLPIGIAVEAR
jgi:hypothetical protein